MIASISQLIAQAESSSNPWAVRFEPAYTPNPGAVMHYAQAHGVTTATAAKLLSMSWGMFQEMGDNLVRAGLATTLLEFAADPQAQQAFFSKYLVADGMGDFTLHDLVTDPDKRLEFARLYNGPGEPQAYAAYLMRVYQQSGGV